MKQSISVFSIIVFLIVFPFNSQAKFPTISKSGQSLIWGGCGITKKAFMAELAKAYEAKTGVAIKLQGGGATKGIRAVGKETIHIGGACRASMEFHKEERYVKQIPVAWDAIVFITNKNNPVDSISMEQVRGIYNGDITNWSQLGGVNADIDLYVRKSKISGVGQTLRELVFNDSEKEFTETANVVKSSGPAEKSVEKSFTALTATGISSAKRRNVKMLKIAGQSPSFENIKAGRYILYRPLYLVTKLTVRNPRVKDFITYATSEEGKAIIRDSGTVPYTDALHLLSRHYRQYDRAIASGL